MLQAMLLTLNPAVHYIQAKPRALSNASYNRAPVWVQQQASLAMQCAAGDQCPTRLGACQPFKDCNQTHIIQDTGSFDGVAPPIHSWRELQLA